MHCGKVNRVSAAFTIKYCVDKPASQKSSQDMMGRINNTFSALEKQFSRITDRHSLYDKIIEWANARKTGGVAE